MSDTVIEKAFKQGVTQLAQAAKKRTYVDTTRTVKGILINRDPPISNGWCGNDECEHTTHKDRRAAQAAADKRRK